MSQNQNDERPQDAAETMDETQQLEVAGQPDETQVLDAGDTQLVDAGDTRVLKTGPAADETQVLPAPADPDEPLSVFDQPATTAAYTAASYGAPVGHEAPEAPTSQASGQTAGYEPAGYTAAYGSTGSAPGYGSAGYGPTGQGAAGYPAGGYQTAAYPTQTPSYVTPGYEPMTWTAPPKPLVKTTPRTSTIVWGFIILAIGIGAISVAAGASLDVGLATIWLLAAAGAVLVVASVVGAARRRNRESSTADA
ncbi:hypothetical protein [Xylanimonas protaetiae]|uniref:Uncharacterized protein n=1 Tax=Xylanimonas protaetiae TaxID=2509457 RepID=A0A4P6F733_9MICO|nr:hypothetical protein [Xylanimonas protaetiae]QAY70159.1 hypothetical protein ET471_09010 [Xylanimonas protaetiae]